MVQGKKQETNSGGKPKLPDHYRCKITCAFCGKRKHYDNECYHKQRLSAKLKTENGSGKGSGESNTDQDSGKGKLKGRGKGQEKGKDGRGDYDCTSDKDKNTDQSGENPNPTPRGNSEPSGEQPKHGSYDPFPGASQTRTRDLACQQRWGPVKLPQTFPFHAHGAEIAEEGV